MDHLTAWQDKARLLDRYRWRLLRAKHDWMGSALRFFRDAVIDWVFGVAACLRCVAPVSAQSCDFLLLQAAPKVIPLKRKKLLIDALQDGGYTLVETAIPEWWDILRSSKLARPPQAVPWRYYGYAAYACWLVAHHVPKILLNDRNGSFYSPFLRLALQARGGLLVHLAHATTMESSSRLGMNDYDYYFLFGQSSLDALETRSLRFGESTIILSGSHMVDKSFDLLPADCERRVLLILGVGPDKEKEAGYQQTYALLRDWASSHPEYRVVVKAHPRSKVPFWQEAASTCRNIEVLPNTVGLAAALEQASIVVNIMSNAVVEATLARRPIVYVNSSGEHDIFSQAEFFGGCVDTVDALSQRVAAIEHDYMLSIASSARFAEYHLAHGSGGFDNTLDMLEKLLAGERPAGVCLPVAGLADQQGG